MVFSIAIKCYTLISFICPFAWWYARFCMYDHSNIIKWYTVGRNDRRSSWFLYTPNNSSHVTPGIIPSAGGDNERQLYILTSHLIGWAHTHIDPWDTIISITHTTQHSIAQLICIHHLYIITSICKLAYVSCLVIFYGIFTSATSLFVLAAIVDRCSCYNLEFHTKGGLSLPASVHPSVRLFVCKLYLGRTVTRHRFELESQHLHQTCIMGYI